MNTKNAFVVLFSLLTVMWGSEIIDVPLHHSLDAYGIRPLSEQGLLGILFAPFLHGGFGHLIGNTIPFVVLGALIVLFRPAALVSVTLIVALLGGLGVWLLAPTGTVHIGASGIVFGYAGFLLANAWISRNIKSILLALPVLLFFTASLLSGLLPQAQISWQGHASGLLAGIFSAYVLKRNHNAQEKSVGKDPLAELYAS